MALKKKLNLNVRTVMSIFNQIIGIVNVKSIVGNLSVKRLLNVIVNRNGLVKMKIKIISRVKSM